jgi:hypothetical protein
MIDQPVIVSLTMIPIAISLAAFVLGVLTYRMNVRAGREVALKASQDHVATVKHELQAEILELKRNLEHCYQDRDTLQRANLLLMQKLTSIEPV